MQVQVAGLGGVPEGADAAALIVHTISPVSFGNLTVWPTGEPKPAAVTLGYEPNANTSGATIVPLGPDGTVTVEASADSHLVVQTVGWYETATKTWTYTYDGDGLRRTKTGPDGTTTTFTWDRSSGEGNVLGARRWGDRCRTPYRWNVAECAARCVGAGIGWGRDRRRGVGLEAEPR